MKTKPELLLPAGNFECLTAAVNAGADAVYLGLESFSARAKAQNFSSESLKQAIDFAHLRGVRVYVAANTLIKNNEVESFLHMVAKAYEAGADAVILQSLQLAKPILRCFKGLKLHASTQMGIHTLAGANEARRAGFSRVILSRETPFCDIEYICKNSDIEIEVFIHGAMCVSFSGGCYMSSFITGNSGNRGRCIQPCRLQYTCDDLGGGEYKLSLSDLFADNYAGSLAEIGVSSLKVEGRMRSAEYVYSAGSYYRNILDGKQPDSLIRDRLVAAFNRGGFTKGHIAGCSNIASDKVAANIGLKLGVLQKLADCKLQIAADSKTKRPVLGASNCAKGSAVYSHQIQKKPSRQHAQGLNSDIFFIKTDKDIGAGDGFKVLSKDGIEKGSAIYRGKASGGFIVEAGGKVQEGDILCLTKDSEYAREVAKKDSRLPVDIYFYARTGELPLLKISCCDVDADIVGTDIAQPSAKDLTENYLQSLGRMGGSDFKINSINANTAGAFVPISVVNNMRRQACDKLTEAILHYYCKANGILARKIDVAMINDVLNDMRTAAEKTNDTENCLGAHTNKSMPAVADMSTGGSALGGAGQKAPDIAVIADSAEGLEALRGQIIIYKPHNYTLQDAQNFLSKAGKGNRLFLYMPTVMTHDEERLVCEIIADAGFDGAYVNSVAGYAAARSMGIKIFAGTGLNVFNDFQAAQYASEEGFCYSKELTLREIEEFSHKGGYVFAYGDIMLMTMSHCAHRALSRRQCQECQGGDYVLSDRIGAQFAVRRVKLIRCYFELYNAKKLNGLSRQPLPCKLFINLCGEGADMRREIVARISNAQTLDGGSRFTSGHLYRGVY